MSFLAILETLKFEFLVNWYLKGDSNLLKSKFRTSKIAKMTFLDHLNAPKFDFHVKLESQLNNQVSTKSSLNFTL